VDGTEAKAGAKVGAGVEEGDEAPRRKEGAGVKVGAEAEAKAGAGAEVVEGAVKRTRRADGVKEGGEVVLVRHGEEDGACLIRCLMRAPSLTNRNTWRV
jgi:hypothetical protein